MWQRITRLGSKPALSIISNICEHAANARPGCIERAVPVALAAEAAALVSAEHNAAIAALEADWMARREDAVKISARNLHDMHQEALRKALFDKDAAHEEALEKVINT